MNRINNFIIALAVIFAAACSTPQKTEVVESEKPTEPQEISYDTNDPKSIIKAVEMSCGGWNKLWEQKDVEFTYSYLYPQSGQLDFSTERYVFDTEQSWAKYTQHDINVMPGTEGEVTQYYDGAVASCMQDTVIMDDPMVVGGTEFLRKANYFWFVMMFKLDNPGAQYEYLGAEAVAEINYDKVKVTYDSTVTGKDQNDTYILYVNPDTKMVDQFYFSLPVAGVNDPLIIMKLTYEDINGLKISTKRDIYMPSPDGYSEEPNLVQTSTNVKFNNGFTEEALSL